MDVRKSVASQFHAALSMMEQTVCTCPEELWNVTGQTNPFWRVAYHALFFVDLYLQPSEDEMTLWEVAREGYQFLGPTPWPPHTQPRGRSTIPPSGDSGLYRLLPITCRSRCAVDRPERTVRFPLAALRQNGTPDLQYPPSAAACGRPEHLTADAGRSRNQLGWNGT